MSVEIKITPSSVAINGGKGVRVVPQFVSILNSKGLEPSVGAEKNLVLSHRHHCLVLVVQNRPAMVVATAGESGVNLSRL